MWYEAVLFLRSPRLTGSIRRRNVAQVSVTDVVQPSELLPFIGVMAADVAFGQLQILTEWWKHNLSVFMWQFQAQQVWIECK